MPNTYTQLQIHFVFAVKWRLAVIDQAWEERLHQYITAIVQNNQHKMLAINSAYDHYSFSGWYKSKTIYFQFIGIG